MARADLVGDVNSSRAWTRRAGSYSDVETPAGMRFTALDPYRVGKGPRLKKVYDQQYHEKRHYRGVPLLALVDSYAAGQLPPGGSCMNSQSHGSAPAGVAVSKAKARGARRHSMFTP